MDFTRLTCSMCIDMEILVGIARGQFLTELSAYNTSDFSFPDDNLNKYQLICTKLGLYIDIVEIWFASANYRFTLLFPMMLRT